MLDWHLPYSAADLVEIPVVMLCVKWDNSSGLLNENTAVVPSNFRFTIIMHTTFFQQIIHIILPLFTAILRLRLLELKFSNSISKPFSYN